MITPIPYGGIRLSTTECIIVHKEQSAYLQNVLIIYIFDQYIYIHTTLYTYVNSYTDLYFNADCIDAKPNSANKICPSPIKGFESLKVNFVAWSMCKCVVCIFQMLEDFVKCPYTCLIFILFYCTITHNWGLSNQVIQCCRERCLDRWIKCSVLYGEWRRKSWKCGCVMWHWPPLTQVMITKGIFKFRSQT